MKKTTKKPKPRKEKEIKICWNCGRVGIVRLKDISEKSLVFLEPCYLWDTEQKCNWKKRE